MKDDSKGKVIFSLLAGATAGIVAGLLFAPETGDDTRSNLRRSASKWGGDLSKLVMAALAKAPGTATTPGNSDTTPLQNQDKAVADRLLQGLGRTVSTAHTHNEDNPDYDGFGDDTRHQAPRKISLISLTSA